MSHSASDGMGNRLYLLIPLALPFSLSLSLALSHSTPPLIHLLRTLLNISPNPIFLPRQLPAFSLSLSTAFYCPFLSSQLPTSFLFSLFFFFFKHPPPLASPHSPGGRGSRTYSAQTSVRYHKISDVLVETRTWKCFAANMLLSHRRRD